MNYLKSNVTIEISTSELLPLLPNVLNYIKKELMQFKNDIKIKMINHPRYLLGIDFYKFNINEINEFLDNPSKFNNKKFKDYYSYYSNAIKNYNDWFDWIETHIKLSSRLPDKIISINTQLMLELLSINDKFKNNTTNPLS